MNLRGKVSVSTLLSNPLLFCLLRRLINISTLCLFKFIKLPFRCIHLRNMNGYISFQTLSFKQKSPDNQKIKCSTFILLNIFKMISVPHKCNVPIRSHQLSCTLINSHALSPTLMRSYQLSCALINSHALSSTLMCSRRAVVDYLFRRSSVSFDPGL